MEERACPYCGRQVIRKEQPGPLGPLVTSACCGKITASEIDLPEVFDALPEALKAAVREADRADARTNKRDARDYSQPVDYKRGKNRLFK